MTVFINELLMHCLCDRVLTGLFAEFGNGDGVLASLLSLNGQLSFQFGLLLRVIIPQPACTSK